LYRQPPAHGGTHEIDPDRDAVVAWGNGMDPTEKVTFSTRIPSPTCILIGQPKVSWRTQLENRDVPGGSVAEPENRPPRAEYAIGHRDVEHVP
jgi:hypothetical protein